MIHFKQMHQYAPATALSLILIASCSLPPYLTSLMQVEKPQGFVASEGDYFPEFVDQFFVKTKEFEANYPLLHVARDGIAIIQVRPLTRELQSPVNESNLSWSQDGVYLGYEVIDGKKRNILVKNLVGDYSKNLAVLVKGRGDFLDGMIRNNIVSYNAGLRWSYDSTRFAFMSNGGVGEYNIYVGAVKNQEQEQVVAQSPTKDGYATWNPRYNEIAFVTARSGYGDIYSLDLDSDAITRLTFSDEVDLFPSWFPNGKSLVFSSGTSIRHSLWIINKTTSWHVPYQLTDWNGDDLKPVVSPNGELVAFYSTAQNQKTSYKETWNLHVIKYVKGKTYTHKDLIDTVVASDVVVDINTGPAWSPDSQKIFFIKNDPQNFNPIYGYNLYTGRLYFLKTGTKMNRDLMMSSQGVLSFRAQVGVWDKVYLALTNQGEQFKLTSQTPIHSLIHYARN